MIWLGEIDQATRGAPPLRLLPVLLLWLLRFTACGLTCRRATRPLRFPPASSPLSPPSPTFASCGDGGRRLKRCAMSTAPDRLRMLKLLGSCSSCSLGALELAWIAVL